MRICPKPLLAFALIPVLLFTLAGAGVPKERSDSQSGNPWPDPPEQHHSWKTPSTHLPKEFVDTTRKLFHLGLADPRSCEYRDVEVQRRFMIGYRPTHAWVLPAGEGTARYAVGWNGVLYPVTSIGVNADVRRDVLWALKNEDNLRENLRRRGQPYTRSLLRPIATTVYGEITPLMAAMLLRLGATDLAERVWDTWFSELSSTDAAALKDPYLLLAGGWANALFARASNLHHELGDDRLAFLSARALMPIQQRIDDEAEKRGFSRAYFGTERRNGWSFLRLSEPLKKLIQDTQWTDYFIASSFPQPPMQNRPWETPAASFPETLLTATERLFEQGLPDPRGCEYREVVVAQDTAEAGKVTTHLWVLPPRKHDTYRFAIGWNGLLYPTAEVGPLADVHQDVLTVIANDTEQRRTWNEKRYGPYRRFASDYPALRYPDPLAATLLLRLGETEFAEKMWSAWSTGLPASASYKRPEHEDPYLMLARSWTAFLMTRAGAAHMRGDNKLALLTLRALAPIQKSVDEEAERRGFTALTFGSESARNGRSFLPVLGNFAELLTDQERRASEPQTTHRIELPTGADKPTRIAAHIKNLEQAGHREFESGGGYEVRDLGNDLVEPLLLVVENDTRLTRYTERDRGLGFGAGDRFPGVYELALRELIYILGTSNFGEIKVTGKPLTLDERNAVAAEIRSYFHKYCGGLRNEQWYRLLADDGATVEQWQEAAQKITQPVLYDPATMKRLEVLKLQGESLRDKTDPSVSQLLLKRMNQIGLNAGEAKDVDHADLSRFLAFGNALAIWDAGHYREELHQICEQWRQKDAESKQGTHQGMLLSLYFARIQGGDSTALREYADWLVTVNPSQWSRENQWGREDRAFRLFQPAWHHPEDPALVEAMNRVFGGSQSAWLPVIKNYTGPFPDAAKLLPTPLLSFEAFRGQVIILLNDKTGAGTLEPIPADPDRPNYRGQPEYILNLDNPATLGNSGKKHEAYIGVSIEANDSKTVPRPLQPIKVRMCDIYAWRLTSLDGAPPINLYWPEAQREAAVTAMINFLRTHTGPFTNKDWRRMGEYY